MLGVLLTVIGLSLFEIISSIDNAIVNAEVLSTMGEKSKRFFLFWGMLFAVVVVRGLLPLLIVLFVVPSLSIREALFATFNNDPAVIEAIERSAPYLLMAGGIFLVFIFFNWLFLEEKYFGLPGERFLFSQGVWFYAVVSLILTAVIWQAIRLDPILAFSAALGSSAFFITHGFRQQAELAEKKLMQKSMSDISKILYLEVIDASFSIDGVLGSFAFTFSIPLILLGNGLGAVVLRQLTVTNINRVKKYIYLKNGAMYSILVLGSVMVLSSFGLKIPQGFSPLITIFMVVFFYLKSKKALINHTRGV